MIKQLDKIIIEKKRRRKEKKIRKNKKRKHDKKMIEKTIKKKSSKVIFDEFSLSFARTIIILKRILNLISYFSSRARQLSNELKKVRQRYQMKRMTKLNQSKRFIIDEMLRYEYDLDILKHFTQIIIFFTSINIRTQMNMFIDTHRIIFQTSSIVDFSATISNAIFDLKKFLSKFETIIFNRDEIKKNVSIDQIRVDSQLKQIILTSFNKNDAIMRKMIKYDNEKRKLNIKNKSYRVYREISLKIKNIVYRQK
jgi:hypothetical protein